MTTVVRAAVTREFGAEFELVDLELGDPDPDEIVVRMVAVGICHSDISTRDGIIPIGLPVVLGHEGAGVVEKVGPRVSRVQVGDRVLLHSSGCGTCSDCEAGRREACVDSGKLNFSGSRLDGSTAYREKSGGHVHSHFFGQSSFARRVIANQRNATVLPNGLELTAAPAFACGVMTGAGTVLTGLRPGAGSSMAVFGTGAVGSAAIMAAAASGCTTIVAVDVNPGRLAMAEQVGATATVMSTSDLDLAARVRSLTDGRGADFVVEATGVPAVIESAFASTRPGGAFAQLGFSAGARFSLDLTTLGMSAVRVQGYPGGMVTPRTFLEQAIALREAGRFPVDRLVRTYPFEEINAAAADAIAGTTIKPILVFGDDA